MPNIFMSIKKKKKHGFLLYIIKLNIFHILTCIYYM